MTHQLASRIVLGVVLTCGLSAIALAQLPNVDTSKLDTTKAKVDNAKAKVDGANANVQQAKTSADESTTAVNGVAADAKETAGAVKKKDLAGVKEGAAKGQKKAKSAKTSGTKSTEKAKDAAKDLTGK